MVKEQSVWFIQELWAHRPVESFNIGKKGEHKQRIKFVEPKNCI